MAKNLNGHSDSVSQEALALLDEAERRLSHYGSPPGGLASRINDFLVRNPAPRDPTADLLEALERLAIFHQPTHPKHGDMHEEYAEDCIANEISYSSATLLDSLVRAANAAIAKARGEVA